MVPVPSRTRLIDSLSFFPSVLIANPTATTARSFNVQCSMFISACCTGDERTWRETIHQRPVLRRQDAPPLARKGPVFGLGFGLDLVLALALSLLDQAGNCGGLVGWLGR
ncbi:hypothetical protein CC80DRAFT_59629 [Byssothecium circinans]|uniref:Uncharacterized protein n=1 Tax=Byssothecium circinans TaxID=147558 RepID=A0A6A5TW40_9PLEO|nr:hypothetical protein CC80DRAFT_59629 [Byssothecium circinans]